MNQTLPKKYPTILNRTYAWNYLNPQSALTSILFLNQLFNTLSLGLFYLFSKADFLRIIIANLDFSGRRFQYVGNARQELRKNGIFYGLVFLPLLVLPVMWFWQRDFFAHSFIGCMVFLLIAYPLAKCRHLQYVYAHIKFESVLISFRLSTAKYVSCWAGGFVLTILSCGLYLPFWRNQLFALRINSISMGPVNITYQGKAREIFNDYFWAVPFLYATGGLYWPWFICRLQNYRAANIWVGGEGVGCARGYLNVRPGDYFYWHVLSCVCLLLSCGLAWPWLKATLIRYQANQFSFIGNINLNALAPAAEFAPILENAKGSDAVSGLETLAQGDGPALKIHKAA